MAEHSPFKAEVWGSSPHGPTMKDIGSHSDHELDLVYDLIDELLLVGKFETVDHILRLIHPLDLPIDLVLGYLTVTLAAKSKLPWRKVLFAKCKTLYAQDLIQGLE